MSHDAQQETNKKVTIGICTPNTFEGVGVPSICEMCKQSSFKNEEFKTFGNCDHMLCIRCFNILNGIPQREKKCPICKK